MNQITRGGCWVNDASYLQSASRDSYAPYYTDSYYGFRLVREKKRHYFVRGGSWYNTASDLQSAYRDNYYQTHTSYRFGFRLTREKI